MITNNHLTLVTGAAGTMGKAIVNEFVARNVRVAAVDINPDGLKSVVAGGRGLVHPFTCDISDPAAVHAVVESITQELGRVDVLVNNAGILSKSKVAETTADEWNKIMSINLNGAFYLTKELLPQMRAAKWGRIINISSYAAKSGGLTAGTAYSVSKAAMIGLTFSVAAETTRDGITVNAIAPAYVRTPMVTEQLSDAERAAVEAQIPVGRFCEPEEFAHAVMFLASEKSGFITGEVLDMNGGFHFD